MLSGMTEPAAVLAPAENDRSRWIALVVLCVGMLMIVLDATIVNVALPSIQSDLGFSQSSLAWVVNAYLIAFGGLLLLSGRLGDLIRRVFMVGLAVFTAASLLCAVAQSQGLLIGACFVQGIGGALTSAVILGMIVTMFPEPREQAKAIGVYSFVASSGGSIGLLAGGVLTEAINWHWIFFVNLPIGIATALVALRLIERDVGIGLRQGADVPGAAMVTGALMLGVYTILEAGDYGWGSLHTLGLGGLSVALLIAFVARQARIANPLMPLRLFRLAQRGRGEHHPSAVRRRDVRDVLPRALYMQRVLGYDALEVGLPARHLGHRNAVAGFLRAAQHALRPQGDAATRLGPDRGRPGALCPGARRRKLHCRHPAIDGSARTRRRGPFPR